MVKLMSLEEYIGLPKDYKGTRMFRGKKTRYALYQDSRGVTVYGPVKIKKRSH